MAFPTTGWPPRFPTGVRSLRVYKTGTATTDFSDNAFVFAQITSANPYQPTPVVPPGSLAPVAFGNQADGQGASFHGTGRNPVDASPYVTPQDQPAPHIWSGTLMISNDGANPIEFSFDGTNVHGKVLSSETRVYRNRHEAGIALRTTAATSAFRMEAW